MRSIGLPELLVLLGVAALAPLYFLPAILGRRKRNAGAILALNLLLGWTLLGWVGALVWALTKEDTAGCPVCHAPVNLSDAFCKSCGNAMRRA